MTKNKQFGKLSAEQARAFLRLVQKIGDQRSGLIKNFLRDESLQAFIQRRGGIEWSIFYELPFHYLLALFLILIGDGHWVKEAAASEDPQQVVLDYLNSMREPKETSERNSAASDGKIEAVLTVYMACVHSVFALPIYFKSLNQLVELARRGDKEATIHAVSIDRTIISCPSVAGIISRAHLANDRKFIKRLNKAMLNGPHKGRWQNIDLRRLFVILEDAGGLKSVHQDDIYELVVTRCKAYSDRGEDPMKAIMSRISAWSRESTK